MTRRHLNKTHREEFLKCRALYRLSKGKAVALFLGDSQYSEPNLSLFCLAHSEYTEGQLSARPERIRVITWALGRVAAAQPPFVAW